MRKLLCLLGIHKYEFYTWSVYWYSVDAWNQKGGKVKINKCACCGKYSKPPKWYKKEYRNQYPFVDISGFPVKWHPEVKEIAEL
jgi:hypothetical protein